MNAIYKGVRAICGLFGAITRELSTTEWDRVQMLGILSQFRGTHSTGISVAVKHKRGYKYHTYKRAMDSSGMFYSPSFQDTLNKWGKISAVIGHCRHATVGEINDENAHPYIVDHIIGAHNGTINSFKPADDEPVTDSYKLITAIAQRGIDETLKEVKDGAYALTWFDLKNQTLSILRNGQRSLFTTDVGGTLYWASEKEMLEFMLAKHNLHAPVNYVPINRLLTFNLGEKDFKDRLCEPPQPPVVHRPAYTGSYTNYSYDPYNTWEDDVVENSPDDKRDMPGCGDNQQSYLNLEGPKSAQQSASILLPDLSPKLTTDGSIADTREEFFLHNYGPLHEAVYWNDIIPGTMLDSMGLKLPLKIKQYGQTLMKFLRYRKMNVFGQEDFIQISEAFKLLKTGCIWSKREATIFDDVVWINEDEYILAKYQDEDFFREYNHVPPVDGGLYYVPTSTLLKMSRNKRN